MEGIAFEDFRVYFITAIVLGYFVVLGIYVTIKDIRNGLSRNKN
jgi:uncharacterized protein YneF (UPF0154 family)